MLACFACLLDSARAHGQSEAPTVLPAAPAPPPALPAAVDPYPTLTLEQVLQRVLQHNPQLLTVRQQHGIAAAGVVIARQYPFNPIYQSFVMGDGGPTSAGITNRVFNEHVVRLDLELRGQGKHRRAAAAAALSRTDWEIATQEVAVAVSAIRAFDTVLYRKRKLDVLEETVRLNEHTVEQVRRLVDGGKLRPTDLILARTEVDASRALLGQGRTGLAVAWNDLRRLTGGVDDTFGLAGRFGLTPPPADPDKLREIAVEERPDVQARRAAVEEAEARWRFECANRFGNPSIGPAMEYNETSVVFVGMWLITPLPVLNTRRGEIQQRDAERARAHQEWIQFQVQAELDVRAALARLADARSWAESYEKEVLPNLERSRKDLEKLFTQGEPGADALRVIDVQRKYLKAQDNALDALFEVSQAVADLAAAVGDPSLAVVPCAANETVTAPAPFGR
jgi:outer membrane protein TolC